MWQTILVVAALLVSGVIVARYFYGLITGHNSACSMCPKLENGVCRCASEKPTDGDNCSGGCK